MMVRMTHIQIRAVLAAMVLTGLGGWPAAAAPARWQPQADATWQVQFSGRLDTSVDADVFDLDLFDTTTSAASAPAAERRHRARRRDPISSRARC